MLQGESLADVNWYIYIVSYGFLQWVLHGWGADPLF